MFNRQDSDHRDIENEHLFDSLPTAGTRNVLWAWRVVRREAEKLGVPSRQRYAASGIRSFAADGGAPDLSSPTTASAGESFRKVAKCADRRRLRNGTACFFQPAAVRQADDPSRRPARGAAGVDGGAGCCLTLGSSVFAGRTFCGPRMRWPISNGDAAFCAVGSRMPLALARPRWGVNLRNGICGLKTGAIWRADCVAAVLKANPTKCLLAGPLAFSEAICAK